MFDHLVDAELASETPAGYGADGSGGGTADGAPAPVLAARQAVEAVRGAARADLHRLDADGHRRLMAQVRDLESATAGLRSRAISAAADAGTPEAEGAASTADWVKRHMGASGRDAKRAEKLAGALDELPETADALTDGDINDRHAGHIARAANRGWLGDPRATEDQLLEDAMELDPDRFGSHVRRREQEEKDALLHDERNAHATRHVDIRDNGDGTSELHALLPTPHMEVLRTALDAIEQPDPADTPDELARTPRKRRADALVDLAELALGVDELPEQGGARPHVSVMVPLETLEARTGGLAAQAGFSGPISAAAARRLACDAVVNRIITRGDSQVLDVGRATRHWNGAQRRAIVARDGHCRFGDCTRFSFWCILHHVRYWAHGGPSDLDNGVLLCHWHHHAVHDLGWDLRFDPDTGTVTVTSPHDDDQLVSRPDGFARLFPDGDRDPGVPAARGDPVRRP